MVHAFAEVKLTTLQRAAYQQAQQSGYLVLPCSRQGWLFLAYQDWCIDHSRPLVYASTARKWAKIVVSLMHFTGKIDEESEAARTYVQSCKADIERVLPGAYEHNEVFYFIPDCFYVEAYMVPLDRAEALAHAFMKSYSQHLGTSSMA